MIHLTVFFLIINVFNVIIWCFQGYLPAGDIGACYSATQINLLTSCEIIYCCTSPSHCILVLLTNFSVSVVAVFHWQATIMGPVSTHTASSLSFSFFMGINTHKLFSQADMNSGECSDFLWSSPFTNEQRIRRFSAHREISGVFRRGVVQRQDVTY